MASGKVIHNLNKVIHNLGQTRNPPERPGGQAAELGMRSDYGGRQRTNGNRPGTTLLSQRREYVFSVVPSPLAGEGGRRPGEGLAVDRPLTPTPSPSLGRAENATR